MGRPTDKFCSVLFGVTVDWCERSRRLLLSTYSTVKISWQHSTFQQSSQSEILVENRDFFISHMPLTPKLGVSGRWNIAVTFGIKKLEWWIYQMVRKVLEYMYWFRHNTRTWRTHNQLPDRYRMTARAALGCSRAAKIWHFLGSLQSQYYTATLAWWQMSKLQASNNKFLKSYCHICSVFTIQWDWDSARVTKPAGGQCAVICPPPLVKCPPDHLLPGQTPSRSPVPRPRSAALSLTSVG